MKAPIHENVVANVRRLGPTAVFAFDDRCVLGVPAVLVRAGVWVPQDISILGFDDSPPARLSHIDLTTVRRDSVGPTREPTPVVRGVTTVIRP